MKRLREFDVLKGLSITAVVLIHVTSHGVGTFDPTSTSYFVYLILNKIRSWGGVKGTHTMACNMYEYYCCNTKPF